MKKLFSPPPFEDEDKDRLARILYSIAVATLSGLSILLAYRFVIGHFGLVLPIAIVSGVIIACVALVHVRRLDWAGNLLSWTILIFIEYLICTNDGLHDVAIVALPGVLVMAGLFLERRRFLFFTVVTMLSIVLIGGMQILGILRNEATHHVDVSDVIDLVVILAITTVTIRLLLEDLFRSLMRARDDEKELRIQADQLKESESRYHSLFEEASDAILILRNDQFVDCNKRALLMLACEKREELIGRSLWPFVPIIQPDGNDSRQKIREAVRASMDGSAQTRYWRLSSQKGAIFDAEVSLSCHEHGNEVLVQLLVRDITERKRVEDSLRKLTLAVEQSPVSIVITDTAGTIEYVNPKFVEVTGYTVEEAIGKNPSILKSGLVPQEDYVRLWDTITAGGVWKGEFCNRKKNGDLYWERATISPVNNDKGLITHFLAVKEDITLWREAERTLQESEEFHRKLVATVPDLIIRTDLEGNILFVNETGFPSRSYLPKERILGANMLSFVAPDDHDRAAENLRKMVHQPVGLKEYKLILDEHVERICEVNGEVLLDGTGAPNGMVYVVRDITERRQSEENRKMLELQLFQAQKVESIGTLAAGIAHDFNNILHIIMGNVALLGNASVIDTKTARRIKAIASASERGAKLVRQLLTFARNTGIELKTVLINDLIGEMAILLEETLPKSINVVFNLKPGLPTVLGDINQLHQVLMNLCLNARDAMPTGGTLTITTGSLPGGAISERYPKATADRYVTIAVSDNGTGMDESTLKRIFDPFFTTKEDGKGTGLGLAVVSGIIENHSGFIEAKSRPLQGAEFTIYLPESLLSETPSEDATA